MKFLGITTTQTDLFVWKKNKQDAKLIETDSSAWLINLCQPPKALRETVHTAWLCCSGTERCFYEQLDWIPELGKDSARWDTEMYEGGQPELMAENGWSYVCPVPNPEEIVQLRLVNAALANALKAFVCECSGRCSQYEWMPADTATCSNRAARAVLDTYAPSWKNTD